MKKRVLSALLAVLLALCVLPRADAKTTPAGQTVGTVLFYITNADGEELLVSQIPVADMDSDMAAGKIDGTNHNYSLLDKFVTTLHQEAQGFTVPEFIDYARAKSPVAALSALPLTFSGQSTVQFWEIDQTGYDELDRYTYGDLYETPRYNFPLLYEYWSYAKQDYYDPVGKMTREQVLDHIFKNGERESVILSVRAYSQRYMVTGEKFGVDYNMENYWLSQKLLDTERTIRIMKPMTKDELYNKTPTASDTRYWTANILLDMQVRPNIKSLGVIEKPTATMTESGDNYYVYLTSPTPGATILFNHNFISPSYTPTSPYGGGAIVVPKEFFPSGTVTMTARAVKEGYTDNGVVTLKLVSSGAEENPESAVDYIDVPETHWAYKAVDYVMGKKLFDLQGKNVFGADAPMTRAMLATALYRLDGSPPVTSFVDFADITKGTPLSAAVSWAYAAGIVNGVGEGKFAPDSSIKRQDIAAMLYRYATYKKQVTSLKGDLADFTDGAATSDYAQSPLAWAYGCKIITGMGDGRIAPQGTATRAQVAQMLYNLYRL
jgi:hypothetical protein